MATYGLTQADPLLKDYYVPPIIELLNYKTYMIDMIERDAESIDFTGRRAIFPVHMNRNRGRGSRGDVANLPVAGYNVDVDAIVKMRYHYYAMEISDPTIKAAERDAGAFANLLTRETTMLGKEMRKDMNRQVWGKGTGALTTLRATSKEKIAKVTTVQYIGVGDTIDILKTSDGTATAGGTGFTVVKRTTGAEPTVEINTNMTGEPTTEYSVYISGSRVNEIDGMQNIVEKNRTLHEINSETAGQEKWNGVVLSAEENIIGESLFEQAYDEVGATGEGDIEVWVTTRGIRRRLADQYQSIKRANDAKMVEIHGGYTAIFVNEIPVVTDDDAPKGYAFGVNKDSFRWFEMDPPGWLESKDGTIMHLKDATTAGQKMNVWQAWFSWYAALGCKNPGLNVKIEKGQDDTAA